MVCGACRREIANESNFCYLCGARQVMQPQSPQYHEPRRLMRSVTNCKIAGVCGGLAEYWDMDPTIVRLVWVILVFLPVPIFPAFLAYFIAWIVMPKAEFPVYVAAPQSAPSGAPQAEAR